jgi:CRP-like cAMP-binding protein
MSRVIAVCEEERGCPLYRRGARLEFAPPTVSGLEGLPVCASAVASLQKPAERVAAGQAAAPYARTYCGGCAEGKAWWNFEPAPRETDATLSPAAANFILESIRKMKLFAGVHVAKLARIVKLIKGTRVPAGRAIITRGAPGEAFYVVLEGECEVVQTDEGGAESVLAVLTPGECFGEMALITGEPASATVRARGDATILVISKPNFQTLLSVAPEIAITLARILAGRLARTGRWVVEELKKGILGRLDLISPAELIQAMNVNNQTGMLIVQNADQSLTLYMHDGQVQEVQLGDKTGEEAFYEFLSWARGQFRFEPVRKENPRRQIQMDTVGLLLEGLRRADEYRQTAVRREVGPVTPPPAEATPGPPGPGLRATP